MPRKYTKRKPKRNTKKWITNRYLNIASSKLSFEGTLTSSAGGVISGNVTLMNPSSATNWSAYTTLYDQYRVVAVKLTYIPNLPNDTSTITGYHPLFIGFDVDSTSNPANSADVYQLGYRKIVNMYRPWTFYVKVPKYNQISSGSTSTRKGWYDCANPVTAGSMKFYGSGFDGSQQYGNTFVTYYLQFKNQIN